MDIRKIATDSVVLLSAYFSESTAMEKGRAKRVAPKQEQALFGIVNAYLKDDLVAKTSLEDLRASPDDPDCQAALRKELKKAMWTDAGFARRLREFMSEVQSSGGFACAPSVKVTGASNVTARQRGVAVSGGIVGSSISTGDVYYGFEDRLFVGPGEIRRSAVFPTRKRELTKLLRIMSGSPPKMTKVLGFVMADMVEVGDYCFIAGSVIGIKGIQIGKNSNVEGFVMSPERTSIGTASAVNGVYSRWVEFERACIVRGNVFCEQLGDAEKDGVSLDGSCSIENILVSSRSLIIGSEARVGSIICDGQVVLKNQVEIAGVIQARGNVVLGENCRVGDGVVGASVMIGDRSRLGFAVCSETVRLGRFVDVGFLSVRDGVVDLGKGSKIGNRTLASPRSSISSEQAFSILLNKSPVSQSGLFSVASDGKVELEPTSGCGSLLTTLLTRSLYTQILHRAGVTLTLRGPK